MSDAISSMLDRAELCFERRQYKVVQGYLREIDRRTPDDNMPENLADRFNYLADALYDAAGLEYSQDEPDVEASADDSPIANDVCPKCGKSGKYTYTNGAIGTCYDCQGKGYQTEADVERVKRYWAYRKGEGRDKVQAISAKTMTGAWPF